MRTIFSVDKKQIKQLNDEQARELVARLAKAECRATGLPESGVTWGGDQRAKDGGVDVRVKLAKGSTGLDFIKRPSAVFQVKAEAFPPSKIPGEVAPQGKPREVLSELYSEDGAYIIVSSRDDCSDKHLKDRIDKIKETLKAHGFGEIIVADFYCMRRLADWVEKFPAVVTWVREAIGEPIRGWQPYGPWAYNEHDVNAEYIVDDKVRVFVPDASEGKTIEQAIDTLRRNLHAPSVSRIVGLSGVGKTRFVQALFDPRVFPSHSVPASESVIYCDLSNVIDPLPSSMVEALQSQKADCTIIVDNCSPAEHERLSQLVRRPGCQLKLITVEYDVRDDFTEGTSVYRLEGTSTNAILDLLRRKYQGLSSADAIRIADYSDGNARVAFALAATSRQSGDLAQLQSADLFKRLFHQNNKENDDLLRSAEAASLLYSFNGMDRSETSELSMLSSFADCTVGVFARYMAELRRRGLLQERGEWRAILPHAIANNLAVRALENGNIEDVTQHFFFNTSERVARSFARRLSFLQSCPQAVDIARSIMSSDGSLSDVAGLNEYQEQMFVWLAPLAPDLALAHISKALSITNFISILNRNSGRFIKLVAHIAYDAKYFEKSVDLLVTFANFGDQHYNKKLAKERLLALFYICYSYTHATLVQKQAAVDQLLSSDDPQIKALGFNALGATLKTSHFTSYPPLDIGSLPRNSGWRPATAAEVENWFKAWLTKCMSIVESGGVDAEEIKIVLGNKFQGLWNIAELRPFLAEMTKRIVSIESWPEGWNAAKSIIHFQKSKPQPESIKEIEELEKILRPNDLITEVMARIFSKGRAHYYDFDDDNAPMSWETREQYAEKLGEQVGKNSAAINALIPCFIEKYGGFGEYSFGRGLGKSAAPVADLLEKIRILIAAGKEEAISTTVVRGIIAGWSEIDPVAVGLFLDRALYDDVWSSWFIELQSQGVMGSEAFDRLMLAIKNGRTPIWRFSNLANDRVTDTFSPDQIGSLLSELNKHGKDGCSASFEILSSVIHRKNAKGLKYISDLSRVALIFFGEVDWTSVNTDVYRLDYKLNPALCFALSENASENEVIKALTNFLDNEKRPERYYNIDRGKILSPFFKFFPTLSLNAIYQPDDDGSYKTARRMMGSDFSDQEQSLLMEISEETLLAWCKVSPIDRYPFAAATCDLFERSDSDGNHQASLSKIAIYLLNNAPDKRAIIKEYLPKISQTCWSGSYADILERRKPLLKALIIDGDPEITKTLSDAELQLQGDIDLWREHERQIERDVAASFE
ncbi:hypothetical protein NAC44_01915 [Allorhizobium sp. BGMRC 0089]|uniref:hypothetical protein n=1 Tax=Allorhizobium sonneratiae TaxID=2934936 RepID=UPI0020343DF8|nr:hypothetical protein [Allorhizobium sonneratiae]MCM2291084.1 hypothetical protein [Allorhizobium sonneratiae]